MSTGTDAPQSAPTPSLWYELPVRFFARCGPGSVLNSTDPDHPGIYQSFPRKAAVRISPFALVGVRRYSGEQIPLYDAVLADPRTGETIEVSHTDAGGIAAAINSRCGYPHAPMKRAIYTLIADYFWRYVDRQR